MKRIILSLILLTLLSSEECYSQVFTGGNVSVSYENGIYADIAPILGYRMDKLKAGVSPTLSFKAGSANSADVAYGGRVFTQYDLVQGIFAHVEAQLLRTELIQKQADGSITRNKVWTAAIPVGAGYETRISDKARFQVSVLYDLLQDKNAPNKMPTVRGGIVYDL